MHKNYFVHALVLLMLFPVVSRELNENLTPGFISSSSFRSGKEQRHRQAKLLFKQAMGRTKRNYSDRSENGKLGAL